MTTNTKLVSILLITWGTAALVGMAGGYLTARWMNRRGARG